MAYNLEPITRKENLLGLIAGNPHAEHREAITREEAFLSDIAENGGGGGSSLPPYTSADKGKVLTLGDGSGSETVVVVPEQTVTVESAPVPLVGADTSGFVVGNTGVMTVNGTDYNVTAADEEGAIVYGDQEIGCMIAYVGGSVLCAGAPGTYTVSLTTSVPTVEPKWEAASGVRIVKATGEGTKTIDDQDVIIEIKVDTNAQEIESAFNVSTAIPVYVLLPRFVATEPPYYSYSDPEYNVLWHLNSLSAEYSYDSSSSVYMGFNDQSEPVIRYINTGIA